MNRERYHAASPAFDWSKVAGSCVKDVFLDRARELDQGAFVMALDVFLKGSFNSAEHRVVTP
eukprot:g32444.t1